jgi:heterodisulfide reductase subunit A-like polyferredoxin
MKQIIVGINNRNKETTNSKVRADICIKCEYSKPSKAFSIVKEKHYPELQGKRCSKCGCCLTYKIRSNSRCPINKW